jgi:hypothetical protein
LQQSPGVRARLRNFIMLTVILAVAVLLMIGAGLFLTRWFAGYLLGKE